MKNIFKWGPASVLACVLATIPAAPAAAAGTTGEQRTLITLVNFTNDPSTPYTLTEVDDAILDIGTPGSTATLLDEQSYGRAWLSGDVFGWFTVSWDDTGCVSSLPIITDFIISEIDPAIDFSLYHRWIVVSPYNASCTYSGISTLGEETYTTADGVVSLSRVNLNGFSAVASPALTMHELGHSLAGLQHSQDYECGADAIRDACSGGGLGSRTDAWDAMATTSSTGHFSPPNKDSLGWLAGDVVQVAPPGGDYSLLPYETAAPGTKVLRIPAFYYTDDFGGTNDYYISYRKPLGLDAGLPGLGVDGAMIHVDSKRLSDGVVRRSYVLDMSPQVNADAAAQAADSEDVLLEVGETYTDSVKGISITVQGVTGGALDVSVAIAKFCGNGVHEPEIGETCDGAQLGGATCDSLGHLGGVLACSETCDHDRSICGPARCAEGHSFVPPDTCRLSVGADPSDGALWRSGANFTVVRESSIANKVFEDTWIPLLLTQQADERTWIYRNMLPFDTSSIPDGSTIQAAELQLKVVQQGGLINSHPASADSMVLVQPSLAAPPQAGTGDFDQFGALNAPSEGAPRIDVGDELAIGLIKSWPLNATGLGWIDDQGWSIFGIRTGFDVDNVFFPGEVMELQAQFLSSDSFLFGPHLLVDYAAAAAPTAGAAGGIPDEGPLQLVHKDASTVTLSWGSSCNGSDSDYEIYEGTLGDFTSHAPIACTTAGATTRDVAPAAGNRYFLIVPRSGDREGSYGCDSSLVERPLGTSTCLPQQAAACAP